MSQLIGALAKEHGVHPRTIRFYEAVHLLPRPSRTEGGYRIYGEDAASRLMFIAKAKGLGLTLKEIREVLVLRDRGHLPCGSVQEMLQGRVQRVDRQMAHLNALRADLTDMLARCARDDSARSPTAICPVIDGYNPKKPRTRAATENRRG